MHSKELNDRSPLRLLERSIHGGLGRGNVGVVVAKAGMGKTAFLVGVALDDLMRDRKVLHVALDEPVDKIRDYYDEIFMDLARTSSLEDIGNERLRVERNRNIHTYFGNTFSTTKLKEAIAFLRTHMHFDPQTLIIEGYPFGGASMSDLEELRRIAQEIDGELWMSAVADRHAPMDEPIVPAPVARLVAAFDVILAMQPRGGVVHLRLLKDHDNPEVSDSHVALDPTTLLLITE